MIQSHQLDASILRFQNNPKYIDKLLDQLQTDQTLLIDILVGSHSELLTEEELDYLLFLFLAIYDSFQQIAPIPVFDESTIIKAEEASWAIVNAHNAYDDMVEHFNKEIREVEVIEFIDLSIAPDDENEIRITDPGRLLMLAVLSSLVRLLESENN